MPMWPDVVRGDGVPKLRAERMSRGLVHGNDHVVTGLTAHL